MLTAELTEGLAGRVADMLHALDDEAMHIEMGEMADGSTRHYALVTTYDKTNDLEQQFRVTSTIGLNAPAWAKAKAEYDRWGYEVRVGDKWLALDDDGSVIAEASL